jgi:hypothetical protein
MVAAVEARHTCVGGIALCVGELAVVARIEAGRDKSGFLENGHNDAVAGRVVRRRALRVRVMLVVVVVVSARRIGGVRWRASVDCPGQCVQADDALVRLRHCARCVVHLELVCS